MATESIKSRETHKKTLLARLARAEGQIRAIRRMVEEDATCEAVAQQLAASRTALNKAFCEMMACAIIHETDADGELSEKAQKRLSELTQVLTKYG
jgi:DNA-binding FrmR family transcriptional regulator